MAVIPTYNENPEAGQLNGTTKIGTGGSPVAQALQGLGQNIQNVGQVMGQFAQKQKALKSKADIADSQSAFFQETARIDSEVQKKQLSPEDAKIFTREQLTSWNEVFNGQADYDKDTAATIANDFKVKSAQYFIGADSAYDKKIMERQVFKIENSANEARRLEIMYRNAGDTEFADQMKADADAKFNELLPFLGEDKVYELKSKGFYTGIASSIDSAMDEQEVEQTIKYANENKDSLDPAQYADVLRRGGARVRSIKAEEIRLVTQQKRDYKDNYDQYQARSMSTFQSPMSPQELTKLRDANLISDMEVYQGQIQFDKNFKTEATTTQEKNYKDLDYNIKVGSIASYGDIWSKYQGGDITLDDARKAEVSLKERVVATRTIDQAVAFGKRKEVISTGARDQFWQLGKTITTIDEYNDVMQSINDDKNLLIDDRIAQFEAVTALYAQRKDPAMSTAFHQEYIKLMTIENEMRKYDSNFKAGSFTNKIFSAKVKSQDEVINATKSLITQYQAKIDASIQAGLKDKPSYQSGRITVIDSNGKLFTVPASQKDEAIKAGYKVQ